MTLDLMRGLFVYIAIAGALTLLSTTSVVAAEPPEGPTVWISGLALMSLAIAMPVSLAIHQRLRHGRCPRHRSAA